MAQYLTQSLSQQMRLEQRLTPQLIQSMAILQKPITDLEAHVAGVLESNAALEVDEAQAPPADEQLRPQRDETLGRGDSEDGSFARLYRFARDHETEYFDRPSRAPRGDDDRDPKLGAMANTASRAVSLQEHLLAQWSLVDLDDETRRAGEAIINHLDPDGYLRVRLDQVAGNARPPLPLDSLERALPEVQKLEPPGVAARDLVECLLLQLDFMPGDNTLERTLIEHHLDDLMHNRLPAIAKATGYTLGEIAEAIKAMRQMLCLHPGYLVGDRSVPPIRPDVIVEYAGTGGGLDVRLARGNLPSLRIRDEVVALATSKTNGKEERDFARKHIDEAAALIGAIKFRRHRLLDVARAIVERQRDFFDIGPEGLKVLRMSELASELSCDASTISRSVANKYVQTPRGIYPLRYFFTGGTETEDGEAVGWDRVKQRVAEIVESEDKRSPLRDDQIGDILKKDGIDISRRTVAKYRRQLDIPHARQRQRF